MKATGKTIAIAATCTIAVAPLAHAADHPNPDLHVEVDASKTLSPQVAEVQPSKRANWQMVRPGQPRVWRTH